MLNVQVPDQRICRTHLFYMTQVCLTGVPSSNSSPLQDRVVHLQMISPTLRSSFNHQPMGRQPADQLFPTSNQRTAFTASPLPLEVRLNETPTRSKSSSFGNAKLKLKWYLERWCSNVCKWVTCSSERDPSVQEHIHPNVSTSSVNPIFNCVCETIIKIIWSAWVSLLSLVYASAPETTLYPEVHLSWNAATVHVDNNKCDWSVW